MRKLLVVGKVFEFEGVEVIVDEEEEGEDQVEGKNVQLEQ